MSAVTLDSLAVGSSVTLNMSGAATEFIITHQGLPSDDYDDSCNGTWLLMKNVFEKRIVDSDSNDYANSEVNTYLNGTFLELFDSNIKSVIKQATLPCKVVTDASNSTTIDSNVSAKIFIPSATEVGMTFNTGYTEGSIWSYFSTHISVSYRIAYLNGTATAWWTRTPDTSWTNRNWYVNTSGSGNSNAVSATFIGIRPALILPSTIWADESNNIITTPPYNTYAGVSGSVRAVTDYAGVAGAVRSVTTYKGVGGAVRS